MNCLNVVGECTGFTIFYFRSVGFREIRALESLIVAC